MEKGSSDSLSLAAVIGLFVGVCSVALLLFNLGKEFYVKALNEADTAITNIENADWSPYENKIVKGKVVLSLLSENQEEGSYTFYVLTNEDLATTSLAPTKKQLLEMDANSATWQQYYMEYGITNSGICLYDPLMYATDTYAVNEDGYFYAEVIRTTADEVTGVRFTQLKKNNLDEMYE